MQPCPGTLPGPCEVLICQVWYIGSSAILKIGLLLAYTVQVRPYTRLLKFDFFSFFFYYRNVPSYRYLGTASCTCSLYVLVLIQGTAGTRTGAVPYEYLGTAVPRYFQVLNLVPGSMEKIAACMARRHARESCMVSTVRNVCVCVYTFSNFIFFSGTCVCVCVHILEFHFFGRRIGALNKI